jgi:phosphate transport system substrate-binding protein
VHQTIRVTGDPAIASLLDLWENQFRIQHPNVSFENRLTGSASAMAGLYTKTADLAFAGHELLTSESMAFEWIFHYKAFPIEVTSGSLNGPSFAPGFFVNAANPLSTVTLAQANALLSCDPPEKTVPTWGDLGLKGEWANKPIHVYSYEPDSEVGVFIRRKILKNSYKWSCEMKTFGGVAGETSTGDAGRQIMLALREDRYGIGIASSHYANGEVKSLSLARSNPDPAIALSAQTIVDRQYPLTRPFIVYLNRAPRNAADDTVFAFLRFALSKEGQRQVVSSGTYLPLSEAVAREQLKKLD